MSAAQPDTDPVVTRVRDTLRGFLEDHRHKPPRVLAGLVADHLAGLDLLTDELEPEIRWVPETRPDPPSWLHLKERLIDEGVATTLRRTRMAIEALDLDPDEVRAVVIEQGWLRVYRWTDPTTTAQTVPILEDM